MKIKTVCQKLRDTVDQRYRGTSAWGSLSHAADRVLAHEQAQKIEARRRVARLSLQQKVGR